MGKLKKILGMDSKKIKIYFAILLNSQLIYSFVSIRSVLYNPFKDALGVSNTELGFLLSIVGLVQIIGYFFLGWVQDLMRVRRVLSIDIFCYGVIALIVSLVPNLPFWILIICFFGFGLFGDAIYWPTIQKSIRGLAREDKQASAFGVMETVRGSIEFLANGTAIIIYTVLGSTLFGIRTAMAFNSTLMILSILILHKYVPKDFLENEERQKDKKQALSGLLKAMKLPEVWFTGIGAACVYATFNAVTTYFVPFLQENFLLPIAMVSIFGLVNGSGTRVIVSPISGFGADKFFKSSASMMRVFFFINAIAVAIVLVIPREASMLVLCMIPLVLISVCCFFIRGIYYAPIGEVGVPLEITAAAMSVASCIGYSPAYWSYPIFGFFLDKYPGGQGYQYIFMVLLVLSIIGFIANTCNSIIIDKRRKQVNNEN